MADHRDMEMVVDMVEVDTAEGRGAGLQVVIVVQIGGDEADTVEVVVLDEVDSNEGIIMLHEDAEVTVVVLVVLDMVGAVASIVVVAHHAAPFLLQDVGPSHADLLPTNVAVVQLEDRSPGLDPHPGRLLHVVVPGATRAEATRQEATAVGVVA